MGALYLRDLDVSGDFFLYLLSYNTTVLLRNYPVDGAQVFFRNSAEYAVVQPK